MHRVYEERAGQYPKRRKIIGRKQMTVKNIAERLSLRALSMPDPEREATCGYAGDLLSWVMGRAAEGSVWATVMTNVNVIAVAALADTAAVVICEDSAVPDDVISVAKEKGINLFSSELPIYEFCVALSQVIK